MAAKEMITRRIRLLPSTPQLFESIADDALKPSLDFIVPSEWPPTVLTREWGAPIEESHPKAGEEGCGYGSWLVVVREPAPTLIGFALLTRYGNGVEIALEILPEFHSKGLGTDTCRALIQYAFGLPQVQTVYASTENEDASRILKKLNFVEGDEGFFELQRPGASPCSTSH